MKREFKAEDEALSTAQHENLVMLQGDVYNFRVVMLELLTGKKPVELFKAKMARELVAWVQQMRNAGKQEEIFDPLLRAKALKKRCCKCLMWLACVSTRTLSRG
ncbi:tyrosine-sulfated glycopeptide receptor 1 [Olea europaea subsp. europaea]|uniref:non-specific serine/threonine protein kinase n=1 Tax=Olea europaea subsp. europaea TaxID=158383 RepID=A0A8S0S657_OLEEU|nr:tyrosine-sulfated glycopeptide receptor 1 [Olea europaea subsp. europaea]